MDSGWSGGRSGKGRFFLEGWIQNYHVDAAVSGAAFRGIVVVHWMVFSESRGGEAIGFDTVADDEHADKFG